MRIDWGDRIKNYYSPHFVEECYRLVNDNNAFKELEDAVNKYPISLEGKGYNAGFMYVSDLYEFKNSLIMERKELINNEGYQVAAIEGQIYNAILNYKDSFNDLNDREVARDLEIPLRKLKSILKGKNYTLTVDLMVRVSLLTGHTIEMIKE